MKKYQKPFIQVTTYNMEMPLLAESDLIPIGGRGEFDTTRQDILPDDEEDWENWE